MITTIADLVVAAEQRLATALAERKVRQDALISMRAAVDSGDATITNDAVTAAIAARDAASVTLAGAEKAVTDLRAEVAEDERVERLAAESHPTGVSRRYDEVVRIGGEARTYRQDQDPKGVGFVRDVVGQFFGDFGARDRLSAHMREERAERGEDFDTRAAGTGAFAGLVVPQYLTDLYAKAVKAGRPFADACRHVDLPASGMTVNISRITTATTTALQTEGSAVSETDVDDTLLSPPVQTVAGSQTVTRQAVERGTGTLDVVVEDLFRGYGTTLDRTLITQAATGLTNIATAIAYTDGTPTAPELYPKLLQGVAQVEAALLDQDPGRAVAVMHSRRWYWIQSQLSSTFPLIGQGMLPGVNVAGEAFVDTSYGSGFRGRLPGGTPVIVDNNIATNLGAGTNEDEIYFVNLDEAFLWEDPKAPMLIRTETGPSVKSLGVDVVVYGYAAYTFARQPHVQKVNGTGLVTPVF